MILQKSKCIEHPEKSPLVMLRSEYLEITDNHCAAKILSILEFWTNKLREKAEKTGTDARDWIYKSLNALHQELMTEHSINSIRKALNLLVEKGFIARRHNPHIKYDRTFQYKLNVAEVQKALNSLICHSEKIENSAQINPSVPVESSNVQNRTSNNIENNIVDFPQSKTQTASPAVKKERNSILQHIADVMRTSIGQAEHMIRTLHSDWIHRPNSREWISEKLEFFNLDVSVFSIV